MINFYDLIEESNEMKLSNYTLEIFNEMNNIINEKSESFSIVNENAFSTIWNKIKAFFKKIGEFIKKWWNKFLKFIGLSDKDEKDDNPPDSGEVNKDAEEVIEQKKEEENKSEQSTVDNNNTTTDDTNNSENTTDGNGSIPPNIDSTDNNNNGKKESETMEENFKNDKSEFEIKYDELMDAAKEKFSEGIGDVDQEFDSNIFNRSDTFNSDNITGEYYSFSIMDNFMRELSIKENKYKLFKYCLNNSERTEFYLVNVPELKNLISMVIDNKSEININYYNIIRKYVRKISEFRRSINDYNDEQIMVFIEDLSNIMNEMISDNHEYKIDYSKICVKASSTNNYYILRYSMQTYSLLLDDILSYIYYKQETRINICKTNLTNIINELKNKNFDKNNEEMIKKLVNLNLTFTNKINTRFMNLAKIYGDIQNKINNCNKDVIYNYMTGAGLTVHIGKMNFH